MPNGFHQDPAAVQAEFERSEQAEKDRRANAEKLVDARLEARDRMNAEDEERRANSRPNPTQRECDLLKLGVPIDDYENNEGEGSEDEHQRRLMEARLPGNNPYETRNILGAQGAQGNTSEQQPRRGPGRPRRSEQPASE